ncbi:MAG: DUF2271 domain-containing protein [Christensenella sp.]|nr:DUF2271 domain-containing protein [Christensenella sp.]
MKRSFLLLALVGLLISAACGRAAQADRSAQNGKMTVSFNYLAQDGYASNQFAVWVENSEGAFVKTLYVTRFTASGGFRKRPDAIPLWVERSGAATLERVDATSSATPKSGPLAFNWDLTDASGERVPDGTYRYFVEGTLRWKNSVRFTGEMTLNGEATSVSPATAEYSYTASEDAPMLTKDSPENGMITNVAAAYAPPAELP